MTINGLADHIHLFVSMNPKLPPSDLMYNVKKSSSRWINKETNFQKFNWQEGFGAFSYSESQKNNVVQYINNQKEHHKKRDLKAEYGVYRISRDVWNRL